MNTTFDNFDLEDILCEKNEENKRINEQEKEERSRRIKSRQFYPLFRGFPNGSKEYYERLDSLDSKGFSEEEIIFCFMEKEIQQKESNKIKSKIENIINAGESLIKSILKK